MLRGEVEALRVPTGCLDVLAQQVVACVAMDRWDVPALFDLVRGAYPYRDLTASAFESVLKMVSGRFPTEAFRDLRARVSWDRVHNRLHALPGTARLALTGGGTIPDTGQYPVYLGDDGPRLGELDEEFVLERRVGETFVLGTATWRIEAIEPHRVLVSRAEGEAAMMPFWRGEDAPRTAELGEAVGALCREVAERLDDPGLLDWLQAECRLDRDAARVAARPRRPPDPGRGRRPRRPDRPDRDLPRPGGRDRPGGAHTVRRQAAPGLEAGAPGPAAAAAGDRGRLPPRRRRDPDPPAPDRRARRSTCSQGLTAERAEALIRDELGDSALFGLRFRQNAGRALLMPRPDPAKRTPLWLQRLRAKDLLQVVRRFPDFPIVVETYRECLNDDLDLPRLRAFLDAVGSGAIRVVARRGEVASPFASDLIFRFTSQYLYQWDEPRRGDRPSGRSAVDDDLLDPLLDPATHAHWLDPSAIGRVEGRLRGVGRPPRSADEMAETLRRLGDLAPGELAGPMLGFLAELEAQGRAVTIELAGTAEPSRWIDAEEMPLYAAARIGRRELFTLPRGEGPKNPSPAGRRPG